MSAFPYALQADNLPRLGLIVLQVDETIENDFRRLFPPHVARLHVTHVPSGAELTPASIAQMKRVLPDAARLLPATQPLDVVGYVRRVTIRGGWWGCERSLPKGDVYIFWSKITAKTN
ncbi:hypothetical protein [Roseicyclus sp.]|uniref:hypothetical protein n=1 Tax=Roseicyclus sp. TaxID=1914329 RepID=UPI001BCF3C04|nr:hypothetical protein [Roseicyclus sp.]